MCPTLTGVMWEEVTHVTAGGHVKSEYGVCRILFPWPWEGTSEACVLMELSLPAASPLRFQPLSSFPAATKPSLLLSLHTAQNSLA